MTLEDLENALDWGLHDALLVRLEVDWAQRRLTLDARVMCGEHQEADRLARFTLEGLVFLVTRGAAIEATGKLPGLDAGPGALDAEAEAELPPVPADCFLHWLFFQKSGGSMHVCAREAHLTWLEPAPVPSREGRRAHFPGEDVPGR